MLQRRIISAAIALIGSAASLVLSAAHTKKELIDIRHEKWEGLRSLQEMRRKKLQAGLEEYRSTPEAVLLDVREIEDYEEGHLPGAVHAELQNIPFLHYRQDTPLFLYCYRGRRSAAAAESLREAGFQTVKDIGGIEGYEGELETERS